MKNLTALVGWTIATSVSVGVVVGAVIQYRCHILPSRWFEPVGLLVAIVALVVQIYTLTAVYTRK